MNRVVMAVLLPLLGLAGCAASGISMNSMYLKQNYLQMLPYAGQLGSLDDYGVLKVCQALVKLEQFDQHRQCRGELARRADQQGGTLAGQASERLTPNLVQAMLAAMQAEEQLGLGNPAAAAVQGEQAWDLVAQEPHATDTVMDAAWTRYELAKVLLAAYGALDDTAALRTTVGRVQALADLRYRGDSGFRLINDFRIDPMLAEAFFALGDYRQALQYADRAVAAMDSLSGLQAGFFSAMTALSTATTGERTAEGGAQTFADTQFANKLLPRVVRARSLLELGDAPAAAAAFDEILATRLITGIPALHVPVLHGRGRAAEALGNDAAALEFHRRAVGVIESGRAATSRDADRIGYVGNKQDVYRSLVQVLHRQGQEQAAFEVAESAKARALVDLLAGKVVPAAPGPQAAEAAAGRQALADRLSSRGIAAASVDADVAEQQWRSANERLAAVAPAYAALVSVQPPQLAAIQQQLASGELLLEYYGDGDHLFIFTVTRDAVATTRVPAPELAQTVAWFREALQDFGTDEHLEPAQALHRLLVQPVLAQVQAADSLVVVPHGVLHYLPFAALHDGSRFLIDRQPLRILPSAAVLGFLRPPTAGTGRMLVLGNPDLGNPAMDLPGAQREAQALAARATDATVLLRRQATETELRRRGGGYRTVHVASHGVFDPAAPLQSGLLLAGDETHDGRLTVAELYGLDLAADLVTLSACETGLGKVASGDDVVGFSRGLLYAGANAIVASLWQVDDAATEQLMLRFYANLGQMDKRSALAAAQREIRADWDHPYFWAAFQLTGGV